MNDTEINLFIQGLFALNTRRFGTVAEIMIKKLYGFQWSGVKQYDLYDRRRNQRIEVKFSRAAKEHPKKITEANVISQCISDADLKNRSLCSHETSDFLFDSNIQQIKCRNFDFLFYGLFFMDCVEIYGIPSSKVSSIPGYSDRQHAGNIGEGQFHLNNNSIEIHRHTFYQKTLTYYELFYLLQN